MLGNIATNFRRKTLSAPKLRVGLTIAAQNTFTGASDQSTQTVSGSAGVLLYGKFAVRVRGTWSGTVSIQRSTDNGTNWDDVTYGLNSSATAIAITLNGIYVIEEVAIDCLYRVGIKTGNYTSGSAVVEVQQ